MRTISHEDQDFDHEDSLGLRVCEECGGLSHTRVCKDCRDDLRRQIDRRTRRENQRRYDAIAQHGLHIVEAFEAMGWRDFNAP